MFDINKEQKDIKKAAMEFAEGEFSDIAEQHDVEEKFPKKAWKKACELGFIGVTIDEAYEGAGLGVMDYILLLESFCRIDSGCGNMLYSSIGSEFISRYGSEKQKKAYLPKLGIGKAKLATVIDYGGMIESFKYEKLANGNFLLNGSNNFVINGGIADNLVLVARETHSGTNGQGVYSTFIIGNKVDGVVCNPLIDKLGVRSTDFSDVSLKDVEVSAASIIGEEGSADSQIEYFLALLNLYSAAQAIGMSQGCMERSINYSRKRVQFGHPIGWFQLTKFKISDMQSKIEASRLLLYKTASDVDEGHFSPRKAAMAASMAKETAMMVTGETMQIHAGYGYMKEMDIERFYRDVQFLELIGHTREELKILVASDLLGKI